MRLVGEAAVGPWQVGHLEIFFNGAWGQVCQLGVTAVDADLVCRQLGYGAGSAVRAVRDIAGGVNLEDDVLVTPPVALANPGCNGSEARLLDCVADAEVLQSQSKRDFASCFQPALNGVMLSCVREPEPGMNSINCRLDHAVVSEKLH